MPLNPDNLLLKGSSLQNTEYVYGVAVYTGHETKIMQNCVGARLKKSDVQKKMEKYILITILLQFCICLAAGIISATWENLIGFSIPYLTAGTHITSNINVFAAGA